MGPGFGDVIASAYARMFIVVILIALAVGACGMYACEHFPYRVKVERAR